MGERSCGRASSRHRRLTIGLGALLGLGLIGFQAVPGQAGAASVLRPGFEDSTLARNDDGSTCAGTPPSVTGRQVLGFTANFFGHEYARACVNNNGNVTFQQGLSTYTPFGLGATTVPIVAPFFADVDTRGTTNGAQPTRYGPGTVGDHPAFGATWRNVGYYNSHTEHLNTFQVVLIGREDTGAGNFDIEFNYDRVVWESGTASGGNADGLGGTSAAAGYSKGTGEAGTFLEVPGSRTPGSFLDSNAGGLANISRVSTVVGRHRFEVRNGAVQALDSDRDGISDLWEENGADLNGDTVIDVNLPAMGANKNHKDVFIEVDWMAQRPPGCVWIFCWGARSFTPDLAALADVRTAFANADVANPDGVPGINMHIDAGAGSIMNGATTWGGLSRANQVPYDANLGTFLPNGNYSWTEFQALKDANFEENRLPMFHYAVYADRYGTSGSSGISRGIGASDFIVSDGPWTNGFTRIQERGTFMHELGHNLGLRHGGDDHRNYEPNFVSIMNYSFQLDGIPSATTLDYSRDRLAPLNEFSLSEAAGLDPNGSLSGRGTAYFCRNTGAKRVVAAPGTNVDWNCNGAVNPGTVVTDINKDTFGSTLTGYDDWANIVFDGGDVGGEPGEEAGAAATADIEMTKTEAIESHVAAAPGDGALRIIGPSVLVPDTGQQPILVKVENLGPTTTMYAVYLSSTLPTPVAAEAVIELGPGNSGNVELLADTTSLPAGEYDVEVTLAVDTVPRATDAATITVPDMSDPANQQELEDALGELSGNTDPSLDPVLYEMLVQMAATQLGAPVADFVRPTTQRFFVDHPTILEWTASDTDGLGSFDLQHRIAVPTGAFASWFNELAFSPTASIAFSFEPGTHCLRVRARDDLDNLGPYTTPHCFGIPMQAEAGNESAQWSSRAVTAAYHGELLQTRADGATIDFPGIRYRRLVLVASRVPGGGKVAVFVGNKREKVIDLDGALARRKVYAIDTRGSVSGAKRVRIEVISEGDLVQIEGLGVSRM
jgi:hypothetical protein